MGLLFDRKYSLQIGDPTKNNNVKELQQCTIDWQKGEQVTVDNPLVIKDGSLDTVNLPSSDWRTSDANGLEFTDLQITAQIKGDANKGSSTTASTIKVYNLSPSSRGLVEKVNNYVILRAGYAQDDELRVIFTGQVESFETTKEGQDLVTTLKCKDAQVVTNSVRVMKKFPRTQTYGDVITYLAGVYEKNGVANGDVILSYGSLPQDFPSLITVQLSPSAVTMPTGYNVTGYLHQAMEKICKQIGYVSYITNGKLFVHPKNWTKTVEQYEFTSSQMKSIRKYGSTSTNSSLSEGVDGIKIVTFLDGRLDVDKRVKILDGDYEGTYKIVSKSHALNYESGEWNTTISCNKVKEGA